MSHSNNTTAAWAWVLTIDGSELALSWIELEIHRPRWRSRCRHRSVRKEAPDARCPQPHTGTVQRSIQTVIWWWSTLIRRWKHRACRRRMARARARAAAKARTPSRARGTETFFYCRGVTVFGTQAPRKGPNKNVFNTLWQISQ